jgi:predicted nucleic acid-binding protein
MAAVTVRNLPEETHRALKLRAAHNGRSTEGVIRWFDAQDPEALYLTAVTLSEVLIGIALLPAGKRKRGTELAARSLQLKLFASRFLSFDQEAAIAFSLFGSRAAVKGNPIGTAACQIAAIAAVHGFAVATRDTAPFLAVGVPVINPWKH